MPSRKLLLTFSKSPTMYFYLVLNTPEQFSLANEAVIIGSERAYFKGPSEYNVFLFSVALMGIETVGGLQGALVTKTTNSLTIGKIVCPSVSTVTGFEASAVTL